MIISSNIHTDRVE